MRNDDGRVLPFDYVKENREELVPKISEGCEGLANILNYCIDSNMPTIACCAGHKLGDSPYVTMCYDKSTKHKINAFLNKLVNVQGITIMFSTTGYTNNPFNVTIYTNRKNRDNIFSVISDCLAAGLEDDYLREDLNVMLNIALIKDYRQEYATVSIVNKFFQKKYMIGVYGPQMEGNIFDEHKSRKVVNSYGLTYYLYKSDKKLNLVSADFEELHRKNGFRYEGFYIASDASIDEKIDRISEYNKIIESKNGSISRGRF